MRRAVSGGLCGLAVVVLTSGAALAQSAAPTREKVRLRILDACVMTQSGKLESEGAGPKCGCYASRVIKVLTDEEVAAYGKALPARVRPEAEKIFAACK